MIAEVMINDTDRPKQGNYLYGAFGRDFETLDGKRVMVVGSDRVRNGRRWARRRG
jgi:2-methylfumaryl-CoA isomerase